MTVALAPFVVYEPMTAPTCICIKLLSIPVIYYLCFSLTKGMGMYFYINLGISKNEYRFIPFIVEFAAFIFIMVISAATGHAIG